MDSSKALKGLWQLARLPAASLDHVRLTGSDPVVPSSFAVGTAAQVSVAAGALAACELGQLRGAPRQEVSVDITHAALESVGWFSIDGRSPELFDPLSGLYRCSDGWVRLHAVFEHHRRGAFRLLGIDEKTSQRAPIEEAVLRWRALELEDAAAKAGLVLTALRSFAEWDASPQGIAVAAQPLFTIERIGDAPPLTLERQGGTHPVPLPLDNVRVLDLTRILAGPVAGRTLAAYGADVMLVNAPHLPNIEAIAETSRGKLSAHVDLDEPSGRHTLARLIRHAHVFVEGYRPHGLTRRGFGPEDVAEQRPGIVYVTLSAYGRRGPWASRRGFDSLVQTAMGFNKAEGQAAGQDQPRALPMQVIDHSTGFLIAMCVSAALVRQQSEGGSWHVNVSLAQTGHWLRSLGRVDDGFAVSKPSPDPYVEHSRSGFGELISVRHSAQLSLSPAHWRRPSMPPGSHPASWPPGDS